MSTLPVLNGYRTDRLAALAAEVAACERCPHLARSRTKAVFGTGSPTARLMFVGEAPGAEEDRTGVPFVGRAGQLLTDMVVKWMGLTREEVYITNVLKSRPPENRDPLPDEIGHCLPYLERQIEIIRPEYLCLLGRVAAQALLDTALAMDRLRGKWHLCRSIPTIATYHPSYLLRNPAATKDAQDDLQMFMKAMGTETNKGGNGHVSPTIDELRAAWPEVIKKVGAGLGFALSQVKPTSVLTGGILVIALTKHYNWVAEKCDTEETRARIHHAIKAVTGEDVTIRFQIVDPPPEPQLVHVETTTSASPPATTLRPEGTTSKRESDIGAWVIKARGSPCGWYQEYLASPAWQEIRRKIFRRSGGICEGCLDAKANEVHHLTYDNVRNEFAFQLVALCSPCHRRVHGKDSSR